MIAYQTPQSNGEFLVSTDYVLLEPARGLQEDKAILTNLYNYTTPIIRYEIGDVIDFGESNESLDIIKTIHTIHGKYLDFIVLPDKSIISPHVPKQNLTHLDGIKQFQLLQTDINHIIITIQKDVHFTPQTEVEIHKSMNKAFKNQIDIQIKYVESFEKVDYRKFKVIESKIAQEFLSDMNVTVQPRPS